MVKKAKTLSLIQVGSDLEAILLESKLINFHQPLYNVISKDDKSPYFIHLSQEPYPKPIINHQRDKSLAGPFLNSQIPKTILKSFRPIAPYCTGAKNLKTACFHSYLNLCRPCPKSKIPLSKKNQRLYRQNISRLKLLLSGKFTSLRRQLERKMKAYSALQHYEEAALIRNQLSALEQLQNRPILPPDYLADPNLQIDRQLNRQSLLIQALNPYLPNLKSHPNFRLECYDIANIQGRYATAAMTVSLNGFINSANFRHFRIKTITGINDPAMLAETLSRRLNHSSWLLPDLIVLDGGEPQLSAVKGLATSADIPIISLAKKAETIIIPSAGSYLHLNLPADHPGLQLLQHLRDEAHRFSRRLFHKYQNAKITK